MAAKVNELKHIINPDSMELDQQNKKEEVVPHNKVIEITDLPQLLKLIEKSPAVVVDFWATFISSLATLKKKFDKVAEENTNKNIERKPKQKPR